MTIYVSQDGTISLYQGDSGNLTFSGLPQDKEYEVHLAFYDPDSNRIVGKDLVLSSEGQSKISFGIPSSFTDQLYVPQGDDFKIFSYGLKICSGEDEYTLIPKVKLMEGQPVFEAAPLVYVYPKYVEGN